MGLTLQRLLSLYGLNFSSMPLSRDISFGCGLLKSWAPDVTGVLPKPAPKFPFPGVAYPPPNQVYLSPSLIHSNLPLRMIPRHYRHRRGQSPRCHQCLCSYPPNCLAACSFDWVCSFALRGGVRREVEEAAWGRAPRPGSRKPEHTSRRLCGQPTAGSKRCTMRRRLWRRRRGQLRNLDLVEKNDSLTLGCQRCQRAPRRTLGLGRCPDDWSPPWLSSPWPGCCTAPPGRPAPPPPGSAPGSTAGWSPSSWAGAPPRSLTWDQLVIVGAWPRPSWRPEAVLVVGWRPDRDILYAAASCTDARCSHTGLSYSPAEEDAHRSAFTLSSNTTGKPSFISHLIGEKKIAKE